MGFFEYVRENSAQILELLIQHIRLTAIAVILAMLIGIPIGIFISYKKKTSKYVLAVANVIQAIPSMALLGFMIPLMGIGALPAIVAVVLYSLLPIIKNVYTGIDNINPQTVDAARGIGLTPFQILTKVQIPLALPVIMTGVRVASVTAVGLMTMAAFIGAGGLGSLVFAGIRTVNTNQILAGAIPACILALLIDFLLGIVEKLVTPISLQKGDRKVLLKKRRGEKITLAIFCALLILLSCVSFIPTGNKQSKTITIGSKDFTEQIILANMVSDLIEENSDISVTRRTDIGGTQVCFGALESKDIDMYLEYTGTAYISLLNHPASSDTEKVYKQVKQDMKEQYDFDVLEQLNVNNTYTLAVTKETAEKYNLKTISDLAKVSDQLKSGTTFEFSNREDGMKGLKQAYNMDFKSSVELDGAPRYTAITQGEVDVIDAFSTDGLLKKFDMVTLEDDLNFFPPYYVVPIIRNDVFEEYPEIEGIIAELTPYLNDETMQDLNYQVDELQRSPQEVAHEFLVENGLIGE